MTFLVFVNLSLSQTFFNPLELHVVKCWPVKQNSKIALTFFFPSYLSMCLDCTKHPFEPFQLCQGRTFHHHFQIFCNQLGKIQLRIQASACIHVCAAPEMWGHRAAAATWIPPGGGGGTGQDVLVLLQGTALCQSLWFHLYRRLKVVCTSRLWSDPHWQFNFALISGGKRVNSWWTYW